MWPCKIVKPHTTAHRFYLTCCGFFRHGTFVAITNWGLSLRVPLSSHSHSFVIQLYRFTVTYYLLKIRRKCFWIAEHATLASVSHIISGRNPQFSRPRVTGHTAQPRRFLFSLFSFTLFLYIRVAFNPENCCNGPRYVHNQSNTRVQSKRYKNRDTTWLRSKSHSKDNRTSGLKYISLSCLSSSLDISLHNSKSSFLQSLSHQIFRMPLTVLSSV